MIQEPTISSRGNNGCQGRTVSWLKLEQYHIGELRDKDQRDIASHLSECALCNRKYQQIITDDPTYVYAEFRTKGIGYVDDVELYLDQEASVIHFRSSARLPYFDWGVNRKRMEEIRTAFEAAER